MAAIKKDMLMNPRFLLIDENTRKEIKEIIIYAQKHSLDKNALKATILKIKKPVGDNPRHVIHIYNGFRIVYSIENQPHGGNCHHISISVKEKNKYPSPEAVEEILKEFGMKEINKSFSIWLEKEIQAINILQKIET